MITFKEYRIINELFDNPYNTREDKSVTDEEREHIKSMHGIIDYREHNLVLPPGSPDQKIVSYKNAGAYEVHHKTSIGNGKFVSGVMMDSVKPNPRFVSTMFKHIKGHLDNGHSVRIAGFVDNGMFAHYHKIAKILAKKHNFVMGDTESYSKYSKNPDAHQLNSFTIKAKNDHPRNNI